MSIVALENLTLLGCLVDSKNQQIQFCNVLSEVVLGVLIFVQALVAPPNTANRVVLAVFLRLVIMHPEIAANALQWFGNFASLDGRNTPAWNMHSEALRICSWRSQVSSLESINSLRCLEVLNELRFIHSHALIVATNCAGVDTEVLGSSLRAFIDHSQEFRDLLAEVDAVLILLLPAFKTKNRKTLVFADVICANGET